LEASALTYASRRGLLARRSPLLKLQGDEKLIAMARAGNAGAFEAIVDRYQARLLGFCRQMLRSTEDAEDVLQEVFVNAYRAMLADSREINLRPWLYRIARNRCLNHLRKPTADAQESMDAVPMVEAATTHERVHNREEFRQLIADVNKLPETQRSALLLREMDALSYEEIAQAMETTVPSVKSLLVRARISLAEASQARLLTCGEVRLELAEAAEGLAKASGPVRRHVRECEECAEFRNQVRSDAKVLAALMPVGPLIALKAFLTSKLGLGGAGAGSGAAGGAAGAGAGAVGAGSAVVGGGAAGSLGGALGGAVGAKAVAGVVTAAVLTAGAVEVEQRVVGDSNPSAPAPLVSETAAADGPSLAPAHVAPQRLDPPAEATPVTPAEPIAAPAPAPEPVPAEAPAPTEAPAAEEPAPPAAEEPLEPVAPAEPATEDPGTAGSSGSGSTAVTTTTSPHPGGNTAITTVSDPGTPSGATSPAPPAPGPVQGESAPVVGG
jgi:RNA polymerase sigma factor (sigma-70 family)